MPNGTASREQSSWLTWVVALLTGGLVTQFFLPPRQSPAPASKEEKQAAQEDLAAPVAVDGESQARLLSPLARYFGMPEACVAGDLAVSLATNHSVNFLFVTVADPRDTVLGYRFDLQLDALHKALSLDSFVLDRFYAPWEEEPKKHRWRDEPGVLLYRRNQTGTTQTDLLLVLLIGEQPTSGIQRPAFEAGLKLVAGLKPDSPPPLLIAGTMFTGAAPSLAQAIAAAQQDVLQGDYGDWKKAGELQVKVVSGGAIGIDQAAFQRIAEATGAKVEVGATVGHVTQLKQALIEYVHERTLSRWLPPRIMQEFKVAWLTETVSGYGQSSLTPKVADMTAQHKQTEGTEAGPKVKHEDRDEGEHRADVHVIEIPFPLNMAQIRANYEEARAGGQRQAARVIDERYRLRLGLDDIENARDVPRLFTPQMTSPSNELVLGQILGTIRREGIRYVGISTSDMRDMIFLAQFIKKHYPTCQLLLVTSDVVHLHPTYRQSLAGALVATSYPMLPDALVWYDPLPPPRRNFVLSNQMFYGMFNAVRVLRELQEPKVGQVSTRANKKPTLRQLPINDRAGLIGYRSSPAPPEEGAPDCPPVWISLIGNDSTWPVWTQDYPAVADDSTVAIGSKGSDPSKDYVVRTCWCTQDPQQDKDAERQKERDRKPTTSIASRFVQGALASYLIWLTLSTLVGIAVLRDLKTEWCNPLRLSPGAGKKLAIRPRWFLLGILAALWLSLLYLAALAAIALVAARGQPPDGYVAWGGTLLLALGAVAASTVIMRAMVHLFRRRGRLRHSNDVLWYQTALFQAVALLAVYTKVRATIADERGMQNLILWYNYTYEGFNGVSLALPLTLSLLAVVALCYGLLCQYYLTMEHFVPRPRQRSEPNVDEEKARIQTQDQMLFPIIAKLHKDREKHQVRLPLNHLLVVTIIALWFFWIGWQTVAIDASRLQFAALLLMLLIACVLWGLRLVKTVMVLRQFLVDLDGFFERVTVPAGLKPPTRLAAWEAIFERKPARRRQELGIFFHTGRPRRDAQKERKELEKACQDLRAQAEANGSDDTLRNRLREADEDLYATWIEQFAEQYIAHLRTLIRWLLIAGVLIFLASISYPLNTGQYLRLTTSLMLAALGIGVVYAYVCLDRDPLMSLIVGSKPFEFHFDWNFIRTTAPILIIALITLLSQAFPDAWLWVSPIAEPLMRSAP
jgi:ABC-type multidrug transport system fused ATPase/permease subunit